VERTTDEKTVVTNAAMLGGLLRAFIGDPYQLLIPWTQGKSY